MVKVSRSLRLLIADDHPAMLDGLRYMIQPEPDLEVVAEAADGAECIERFRDCRPDVALVDLQMPKIDGLRIIATLCKEFNDACLIVLTSYTGDARVSRALKFGARAYVLKNSPRSEILQAIRQAATGRTFVSAELRRELAAHHWSSQTPVLLDGLCNSDYRCQGTDQPRYQITSRRAVHDSIFPLSNVLNRKTNRGRSPRIHSTG
jgi:DNA-binding NarL/FixJ family response regulator